MRPASCSRCASTYDVDTVRVEENEVTAGSLALTVRNLDVAAVEAYSAAAADAAAAGADVATLAASLGPHLERALKAGPSLIARSDPLPLRRRALRRPHRGHDEPGAPAAGRHVEPRQSADACWASSTRTPTCALSKTLAGQLATLGARMQLGSDPTIPPDQLDYMAEAQSGLMLTMLVGQGVLIEDGEGYRSVVRLHRRDA